MRVALLGRSAIDLERLVPSSCHVWSTEGAVTPELLAERSIDLLVSFGYRHILRQNVLSAVDGNAVNIHISLLPWNKGADPNLWSWLENTPKGVTIHQMATGVDDGDVITQAEIELPSSETLRSSYQALHQAGIKLFGSVVHSLLANDVTLRPQASGGTRHYLRDKEPHLGALHSGWDTPCADVSEYGRRIGLWSP